MTDNCNVCVHIVQFGSVNKKKYKKIKKSSVRQGTVLRYSSRKRVEHIT